MELRVFDLVSQRIFCFFQVVWENIGNIILYVRLIVEVALCRCVPLDSWRRLTPPLPLPPRLWQFGCLVACLC